MIASIFVGARKQTVNQRPDTVNSLDARVFFFFFYLTKLYIAISADLNLGNIKQHTPRWALLLSISSVITYRNAAVADLDMNQMPYFLLVSSCSGAEGKKKSAPYVSGSEL